MGKATVDLPDPTQQPALEKVGDADELLSEMVGDEIDRMLAGADIVRPPKTPAAPSEAGPPPPETPPPAAVSEAPAAAPPEDAPPIATPEDVQPELDQQLKSLMSKLGDQPKAADPQVAPTAAQTPPAPVAGPDTAESVLEQVPADDGGEPWYVRMLVLANAPLAACPDSWRQAAGKIAIITLIDAAAVLAYVLLFSRG